MTSQEVLNYYSEITSSFEKELDKKRYVYQIHENTFFETEYKNKLSELNKTYWEEILQRAHWAGLSSLIRNLKWIQGVNQSIKDDNLLSFTANLRGLIESCGDNLLSLLPVPLTLADNYETISVALSGQMKDKKFAVCKDLEEVLIHYAFARKISAEEKKLKVEFPKYQNAKPTAEYLKRLDNKIDNGPISEFYSVLCLFSHPTAYSVQYIFEQNKKDNSFDFSYSDNPDKDHIQNLLNNYETEINNSLHFGFNSSFMTLKVLNFFNYQLTKTPFVDGINLDDIKAWQIIFKKFIKQ